MYQNFKNLQKNCNFSYVFFSNWWCCPATWAKPDRYRAGQNLVSIFQKAYFNIGNPENPVIKILIKLPTVVPRNPICFIIPSKTTFIKKFHRNTVTLIHRTDWNLHNSFLMISLQFRLLFNRYLAISYWLGFARKFSSSSENLLK